jgi:hypothetical protein
LLIKEINIFCRNTLPAPLRWTTHGLAVLALAMVGCGAQPASVSGTVRFNGQTLPSGTVLFHGDGGRVEHGLIGEDGRFTIADAPLGLVRITVRSHSEQPAGMPTRGDKAPPAPAELATPVKDQRDSRYVRIPTRYLDPEKSGLTYTVRAGSQTHVIELRP